MLGRRLRISGLRTLDDSLAGCTTQIRTPEVLAKAAQYVGWNGERLMRLRNGWFQRRIPSKAIASSNAVIGFDTSSWILAKRAGELGRAFVLDRTTVHRSARVSVRSASPTDSQGAGNAPNSDGGVQHDLESQEMSLATRIVVASKFAERSLLDAGIGSEKIAVIPYGVNFDWFAGKPRGEAKTGGQVFLYVGHLTKDKGVGILLDAWRQLNAAGAELWLAGGGDAAMIERASGTAGVRVLGKLDPERLREAYQSASAFVFPTYCDGFGMVLLEAMACGLPIIATPNCAAPELLQNGSAGLIVPAGDASALGSAMADVCSDGTAWEKRGAAARDIARTYSWNAYGTRWAALLREVVK